MIFNQFIGKNSSGVLDAYAVIRVEYPVGSACMCSKDGTTFQAQDTSGEVLFGVPEAGDWAITATDGTNTVTKTISITAQYQVEEAVLVYTAGYLFKEGEGALVTLTPYTESTEYVGPSTASIATDYIQIASKVLGFRVSNASVYTDAMDITNLSTLYVEHTGRCHVCVDRMPGGTGLMDEIDIHGAIRTEKSFDISSYTGSARFRIACTRWGDTSNFYAESATVYNWWVE